MPDSRVTIKIPRLIYERIKLIIENSSFSSSTDFIVYVLRDLVSAERLKGQRDEVAERDELSREEIEAIRQRLKSLGYL
jgi:Arc/MetJ-type ribon-helix-helix transcriptional regulator